VRDNLFLLSLLPICDKNRSVIFFIYLKPILTRSWIAEWHFPRAGSQSETFRIDSFYCKKRPYLTGLANSLGSFASFSIDGFSEQTCFSDSTRVPSWQSHGILILFQNTKSHHLEDCCAISDRECCKTNRFWFLSPMLPGNHFAIRWREWYKIARYKSHVSWPKRSRSMMSGNSWRQSREDLYTSLGTGTMPRSHHVAASRNCQSSD